mmetsp:Transcript_20303/g.50487  ORF Transcript_20303/g.50487 Transcript_20303/m.50487 type:complete len:490 (+) Transcript_20303:114-1583(+)|eukprot:CAMPEP_0116085118 /NCGR_PEP_ID=MMETSP0327-20121206/4157_1 /TAXON_ID=44447 /ORGANISM="Pseudo-nitzschia delicatissima, Strain B596" /LENGTH=489 /DNA_ID=CAMNT_0003576093 /DNA_START=46 /DNA_END=1515 /DNA_ORIENTATION=+
MTTWSVSTIMLLSFLLLVTLDLTNLVTAKENPANACDNPDASAQMLEDSIPSLQYNADESDNDDDQKARKAMDFEVYFSAYGELLHQKNMLTDTHRMDSYYTAISSNAEIAFKDKIVMDVGTGSGILAIWAAKAGAKKVYAIEYTDMAQNARKLVEANGVSDIVTVIQGTVEGIKLPLEEDGFGDVENEQVVDVIVSEWMGYMLIRESMLDSVLVARDRYLKKNTGIMLPSHASILIAPIIDETVRLDNNYDYNQAMDDWYEFVESTKENYGGVDYAALTKEFEREQMDFYVRQSQWAELNEKALLAEPKVLKTLDLMTCTHKDTRGIFDSTNNTDESVQKGNIDTNEFDFVLQPTTDVISGFASWFTTDFKSRTDSLASEDAPQLIKSVTLNTGPEQGYTHWGQQVFYFLDAVRVKSSLEQASRSLPEGQVYGETTTVHLKGNLELFRTKANARLYKCRIEHFLEEADNEKQEAIRTTNPIHNTFDIP